MDIPYVVKQFDLEIAHLEESLAEKKDARAKLFSLLSAKEQAALKKPEPSPHYIHPPAKAN